MRNDTSGSCGGHHRAGAADGRLHRVLRDRLATLNEEVVVTLGSRVVAFTTVREPGLPKQVIVLLWLVPRAVAAYPTQPTMRRLMAAVDTALADVPAAFIAHEVLAPSEARLRPGGHDWIELAEPGTEGSARHRSDTVMTWPTRQRRSRSA